MHLFMNRASNLKGETNLANPNTSPTDIGRNRTGIGTSPIHSKEMEQAAQQVAPTGNPEEFDSLRTEISRTAPPVGTVPPPATLKGVAKASAKALQGRSASAFIDKLAERLAFERTGVRLYEAVISTLPASHLGQGTLSADGLQEIHDEELQHMQLVREALESLGADPTAQTPCADLAGVQGMGLVQSISDPRMTLTQRLSSLLIAELTDNDGWSTLIEQSENMGTSDLTERFRRALAQEQDHLRKVRTWLRERLNVQAVGQAEIGAPPAQPQA